MLPTRTTISAALTLCFLSVNAFMSFDDSFAQSSPQGINGTSPQPLPPEPTPIMQELGLTREQVEKLAEVRRQYSEPISQTDQALQQIEQELEELIASPNATEDQIREKYRQVEALRQKLSELTLESRLASRSLLTPAQRRAFAERF